MLFVKKWGCSVAATSLHRFGRSDLKGGDAGQLLFLNGTVGPGKTTVANAMSAMETTPHALTNLDAIRRFSPTSERDPFNHELELEHLAEALS